MNFFYDFESDDHVDIDEHEQLKYYFVQLANSLSKHVFMDTSITNQPNIFYFNLTAKQLEEKFTNVFLDDISFDSDVNNAVNISIKDILQSLDTQVIDEIRNEMFAKIIFKLWSNILNKETYQNINGDFRYINSKKTDIMVLSDKNSAQYVKESIKSIII